MHERQAKHRQVGRDQDRTLKGSRAGTGTMKIEDNRRVSILQGRLKEIVQRGVAQLTNGDGKWQTVKKKKKKRATGVSYDQNTDQLRQQNTGIFNQLWKVKKTTSDIVSLDNQGLVYNKKRLYQKQKGTYTLTRGALPETCYDHGMIFFFSGWKKTIYNDQSESERIYPPNIQVHFHTKSRSDERIAVAHTKKDGEYPNEIYDNSAQQFYDTYF